MNPMIAFLQEKLCGKKVLILGFGREGQSTFRTVLAAGGFAAIGIADRNPVPEWVQEKAGVPVLLHSGESYLDDLDAYDLVIKSPGIVLPKPFAAYRAEITQMAELFLTVYRMQTIGITGTKGKSTTTTLIYHILKEAGVDAVLLGNIGIPAFDMLEEIGPDTKVVFELSCHQLEQGHVSPHIAVFLNLYEEHLDHYGTMEAYGAAKRNIYRNQTEGDVLVCGKDVLPQDDCRSTVIPVTAWEGILEELSSRSGIDLDPEEVPLKGMHNRFNIRTAYEVCRHFVDDRAFAGGLLTYKPLPHRLEKVGTYGGITFYDDSISTTCETTIQAVNTITDADTVIIGGMDRGIDYAPLIHFLAGHPIPHILLMEATGERILKEAGKLEPELAASGRLTYTPHLADAVREAYAVTGEGRACVMSPAAASYGIFRNFEERGDTFKELVQSL